MATYGFYRLARWYTTAARNPLSSFYQNRAWYTQSGWNTAAYTGSGSLLDSAAADQLLSNTGFWNFFGNLGNRIIRNNAEYNKFGHKPPWYRRELDREKDMPKRKGSSSGSSSSKRRKVYKKKYGRKKYSNRSKFLGKAHATASRSKGKTSGRVKRYLKLERNVNNALDAAAATNITINTCNQSLTAAADQSNSVAYFLNTCHNGTAAQNFGDLNRVFGHAFNTLTSGNFYMDERAKVFLKSVHVDFSIRDTTSGGSVMRLRMYECVCRRSCQMINIEGGTAGDWSNIISNEIPGYRALTGTAALTTTHTAWSPYLMNNFCKYFKIVACEDIFIEATQSTYMNKTYKYNRVISPRLFHEKDFVKGVSRVFIFSVLGDLDTTTGEPTTASIKVELNVSHSYSTKESKVNLVTIGGDRPT